MVVSARPCGKARWSTNVEVEARDTDLRQPNVLIDSVVDAEIGRIHLRSWA